MPFEKGNKWWMARTKVGAKRLFENANSLYEACLEYFQWVEDNPLTSEKVGFSKGEVCKTTIEHPRAMTSSGLSLFLGVTHECLIKWKNEREDLRPVILWAEQIIWNQKFTASAAGMLNANIISRELGLADKKQHEFNSPKMVINPPSGEVPEQPPVHGE